MGTPVPLKSRENMCIGAEHAVKTRQLTEEERRYYNSLAKPKKKAVFILPEDVQYNMKRVVILNSESGAETEIPFTKVKAFANNMKAIGDELEGGKA